MNAAGHLNYGGPLSDPCYWPPTTYFSTSSVEENIQYQQDSSLGVLVFSGNKLHFIKIQWHFGFSILKTE